MFKTRKETDKQILKNQVKNISNAFVAIDDARTKLDELEEFALRRAKGECVDIKTVALTNSDLRGCVDRILVGIIDSQTITEPKEDLLGTK